MLLVLFATIILSIPAMIMTSQSPQGVYFEIKENSFLSADTHWDAKADSLQTCSLLCAREAGCESANFLENQRSCLLLGKEQTYLTGKLSKREGSFYVRKFPRARTFATNSPLLPLVFTGLIQMVDPRKRRSGLTVTWKQMEGAGL